MLVMRTFALLSSTPSLRRRLGGGGNLQSCCCRRSSSHQSLPSISVLPPRIIMSIDSSSSRMRSSNDFGCCIRQVASVTSSLLSSCRERGTENQKSQHQQRRYFAATPKQRRVEANAPLLNEHLIAELFNKINKRQDGDGVVAATATKKISADTFQVRLIIDVGRNDGKKKKKKKDITDDDDNDSDNVDQTNSNYSSNDTRIVTLNEAISISHELSLDLMEVTLKQDPPVIKAVSYDKWFYDQKKKQSKKGGSGGDSGGGGGGGGGAISDKPLKEFKFRAGIADHDLQRKTNNMLNYLSKGHAIRVTLTARGFSLNEDADAIKTTLDRVKELIGDKAVEARGMKANDRMSVGNLVFHPNKKIADAKKI